ncbi:DNA-binding protein [Thiocapsa rosea]|uniref:Plasmid replication DNA-binding protein KfrA n=1 Tax=Thiocapsa rosea TaxID=69360 RepID=A0A495VBB2_9GAMM|nr:DNA-binding protein [Thiocapsa rosea]RKT46629.1 plasmid replication DNA-binding protein KfrA [Thiocapsa rosea]
MSSTRDRAKASAMEILCAGQRPTAEQVRQSIGQGAQQTILSALDEFWAEVGERLREPRLPEALVKPVRELWGQAVEEAQRQWASEKTRLEMDSRNLRVQLDAVVLENSDLIAAVEAARTAAAEADARAREQSDRIVALEGEVADAEMQIMRAREEGDQLQLALTAERDGRERDQAAWLLQLDKARQDLKAMIAEKNKLATQLADARDSLAKHRITLARKEQHETDLESRILALGQENARLEELANERSELLGLERERTLRAELARDDVTRSLESAEAERAGLRDRDDRLRLDRERLTTENVRLHAELAAVHATQRHLEETLRLAVLRPPEISAG